MWTRLRQIAFVANELAPVIDTLSDVLGVEPCYVDPGVKVFGLENTRDATSAVGAASPCAETSAGCGKIARVRAFGERSRWMRRMAWCFSASGIRRIVFMGPTARERICMRTA